MIINVDDYLNEAKRQLNNTEFYQKLNQDLTETHAVNETIRKFAKEKLLKEHVAKALTIYNPKTARFYLLPKVHKKKCPSTTPHKRNWHANIHHRRVRRFSITTHCGEVKIIPERYI